MKIANQFNIKSITKKNIPFFIGWIIVFIWLYSYYLPFGNFKFESNLYNGKIGNHLLFTISFLLVGALITLLFDGRKYVPYTFYSVAIALLSFIVLRFTPTGIISTSVLLVGSICMGHIFASSCCLFFMVLNNTEKFYSMILAVFIPKLFLLLKPILNKPDVRIDGSTIIISILVITLLICSFLYKKNIDTLPDRADITPPKKAYSIMLLAFVVLALNDVIAPVAIRVTAVRINTAFEPFYFLGITLGVVLIFIFQRIQKCKLYNVLNLSFAFAALAFVSCVLSMINNFYALISFVFFGISYVLGFVNIYYLAGFMTKKFQSIKFYRAYIGLSSAYYFIAIFSTDYLKKLKNVNIHEAVALLAFISLVILITFLFLTPFFIKNLSSKEWMDDTYRVDITHETRLNARLKDYNLTPREIETCQKLLDGYTLKQIAALMNISFSTVNTYCNSIYKKLNINSRTELVVLLKEYSLT